MESQPDSPLQVLGEVFGHADWRPLQQEVVEAVVGGQDVFVLMPTGGGKSLCYQVPALVRPGTAIVVSPLLALMKDQVDALVALGVDAALYNSTLDGKQAREVLARLHAGELDLLYVSPERLFMEGFLSRLDGIELSLVAIDEAHCVSQWGHDFRPEYRRLGELGERFPGVPRLACTATADPHTRRDILTQLRMEQAPLLVGGFDRPNITYRVVAKNRPRDQLAAFLRDEGDGAGIVYCLSRKGTEEVADALVDAGIDAQCYHAGLPGKRRRDVQEAFLQGRLRVVVATVAFGMGIDKADVRFVVHYDIPQTIEHYYQETGRAGRDGLPAEALLLHGAQDVARVRRLVENGDDADKVRMDLQKLYLMSGFAQGSSCRRRALLSYFGEEYQGVCGCCDICLDPPETVDATEPAQMVLSCIWRLNQRFGMQHVLDVLVGSRNRKVLDRGHDRLSTYGIGTGYGRELLEAVARSLIHLGYVHQDLANYGVLKLEAVCKPLLTGQESFEIARPRPPAPPARASRSRKASRSDKAPAPELAASDLGLFEAMRELRLRLAAEHDVPAYVVFPDATLKALATCRPSTDAAMLEVHGIGPSKLERWGEAFLELLRSWEQDGGQQTGGEQTAEGGVEVVVEPTGEDPGPAVDEPLDVGMTFDAGDPEDENGTFAAA